MAAVGRRLKSILRRFRCVLEWMTQYRLGSAKRIPLLTMAILAIVCWTFSPKWQTSAWSGGPTTFPSGFGAIGFKHVQMQPSTIAVLRSAERCIQGTASDAEAEILGLKLGEQYYDLAFDASILSSACVEIIQRKVFQNYDQATSLNLISFFWRDSFLERLHHASLDSADHLSCDLACLLAQDRRALPSLALFYQLRRDAKRVPHDKIGFLLARALFIKQPVGPRELATLVESLDADQRPDVVRYLYLLGSASFVAKVFIGDDKTSRVCIQHHCVGLTAITEPSDCRDFLERTATFHELTDMVTWKSWILGSGQRLVQGCVRNGLQGPLEEVQSTALSVAFEFFLFDPSLRFTDIVSGFKSGLFKSFDFLNEDISQLPNLDLSKLMSASSRFGERLVDQFENDPRSLSILGEEVRSRLGALIDRSASGARIKLLLCLHHDLRRAPPCDRTEVYLSAMEKSLH